MHHVAVANDVVLSFRLHHPSFLRALLAVAGDVVRVGRSLGANKVALEVGVDLRLSRNDQHVGKSLQVVALI